MKHSDVDEVFLWNLVKILNQVYNVVHMNAMTLVVYQLKISATPPN